VNEFNPKTFAAQSSEPEFHPDEKEEKAMCIKCDQRAELIKMLGEGKAEHVGTTWSGKVACYPEKVWFDVSAAKKTLAACPPIPPELYDRVSVKMLWDTQVSKSEVVAEHLDHVDTTDPVLLVTTHRDALTGEDWVTLIDGNHRVARAYRDGVEYLSAIRLGIAFSRAIMIPPARAVLDELLTEILNTGGKSDITEAGLVIAGGNPAPQTADDHPLRAEYLAAFRNNVVVLQLPRK
jgi:hypothetical protein